MSPGELTICMSFDTQEFLCSFCSIVISMRTPFFLFGLSLQFQQRMAHRAHKIKSVKQVLEISQYGNMVRNAPAADFCSSSLKFDLVYIFILIMLLYTTSDYYGII